MTTGTKSHTSSEPKGPRKAELRPVSSNALKYFVAVAKSGSIRRAAEELHVAASAISRLIQLLEEELDAQLLERHRGHKGLKLTAEGQVVLNYARSIEAGLDAVRDDIQSLKTIRTGKVRFGISESFTREFVPQFLHRFHTAYPGIVFEVIVAGGRKLTEMIANHDIDVSLSYITPDAFNVSVVEQAMTTPCLLVASDHPFAQREFVDISECAGEDIALPDASLTIRESYVRMFAKARDPTAWTVGHQFIRADARISARGVDDCRRGQVFRRSRGP
jgi:DNA-binding transcriptional LysR family regulator